VSVADGHFKSNNHALVTGMLMGYLLKKGFTIQPEVADNGEDWTPRMMIHIDELDTDVAIEVLPAEADDL
jgi:hypothetical protein